MKCQGFKCYYYTSNSGTCHLTGYRTVAGQTKCRADEFELNRDEQQVIDKLKFDAKQ